MNRDRFLARATAIANTGLASGGTAAVLLLLYFVYHYSWTGVRQFSNPAYGILYYVLPLTAAVLLFASLWLAPHLKINLVIALFASAMSLYALELFSEFRRG